MAQQMLSIKVDLYPYFYTHWRDKELWELGCMARLYSSLSSGPIFPAVVWPETLCVLQVKKGGGLSINSTVVLTKMTEKLAQQILHEYSILLLLPPTSPSHQFSSGSFPLLFFLLCHSLPPFHINLPSIFLPSPLFRSWPIASRNISCWGALSRG